MQDFGEKAGKKTPLGRPRMDLRETGWGVMDWNDLVQDGD
jgi:hypothetical protein